MSSDESERVLVLLKELSLLKELDDAGSKSKSEPDAQYQEIVDEIKALAEQKRNGAQQSAPE